MMNVCRPLNSSRPSCWFELDRLTLKHLAKNGEILHAVTVVCKDSFFVWIGPNLNPRLEELAVAIPRRGETTACSSTLFSAQVNGFSAQLVEKLSESVGCPIALSLSAELTPEGFLELQRRLTERLKTLKEGHGRQQQALAQKA
ncbi:hypothetical protein ACSSS7_000622 [Eimeria intestinalis]